MLSRKWFALLILLLLAPGAMADEFSHDAWDALLRKHVNADGWVDYTAMAENARPLDAYIAGLAGVDLEAMPEQDRLATLINAYNAFTIRLILDYYHDGKLTSIMDIPEAKRWDDKRWRLGGQTVSLNHIEHEMIRAKFKEPRIHFALVCAAYSCPKLRNEAYRGEKLEQQLAEQTSYTHQHDRWFRFDASGNVVHLTRLYDWYGGDFEKAAGNVLVYVAQQVPQLQAAMDAGRKPAVEWIEYDWKLNDVSNAP